MQDGVLILVLEYLTVLNQASAELTEKKSRFISNVKPVESEDEAQEFINEIKIKYWDASHNVYAYYIEGINTLQKFSDAGEPAGTAGLPVFEAIRKMDLRNVVVVVTRYFGGTLLGASGLIRAYGKSATLGIEAATVVKKQLCRELNIIVEYTMYGKVNSLIAASGLKPVKSEFGKDAAIMLYVPVGRMAELAEKIQDVTNARAVMEEGSELYITLGPDGKIF